MKKRCERKKDAKEKETQEKKGKNRHEGKKDVKEKRCKRKKTRRIKAPPHHPPPQLRNLQARLNP